MRPRASGGDYLPGNQHIVRAHEAAVQFGAIKEVRGAAAVAEGFAARAHAMLQPALLDG